MVRDPDTGQSHPQQGVTLRGVPAAEARRLAERFECHYTPKHGRWLDLSESELGVLWVQCLNRRIPEKQIFIEEVAAWEPDRNANRTKADWHFTTANARIKVEMIEAMRRSLSLIQLWSAHVARCRR